MILNLPKLGNVRFDDDLTPEQFKQQLNQLSKEYGFELPKSDYGYLGSFTRGVSRGTKQLGSTFGDVIPAMVGKSLGFDEFANRQMGEAAETQRQIQETNPSQFESYKDVKGVGEGTKFFLENLGEQVPNIATSLVPGGIGGTLARRGAIGAAETAAKDAGLTGLEALTGEAAITAGKNIASRTSLGQNIGIGLGSYAQNAPEVFQNIYQQTGKMEPGVALLWGSASAALDSVLPGHILKSLTPAAKVGLIEKVLEKSGTDKSLLRSIATNVLKDAGYEGVTEAAQELISESAEKFVAGNPQIFDSKDWDRAMESAVRGALAGGAFGPITGIAENRQAKNERQQAEDLKAAQELQKQQEEEERKARYYQQFTQQDMLPLSTSVDQAREQQQTTSTQGDLFAGPAGEAAPAIQTQEEQRQPVTYTGQDQLPFSTTAEDIKAQQLAETKQGDLFGYPAAKEEPIQSLVITPELLSKELGVGVTAGKDKRNQQLGIHDTLVGLDAYDLNQNKIIQRRLQQHFEKYGPNEAKAPAIEAFMDKLKSIETEITPKERTEDGTTTQGLGLEGTGTSDALPVRPQAGAAEVSGEPLGASMAFGTTDTGPAATGTQNVDNTLKQEIIKQRSEGVQPEEIAAGLNLDQNLVDQTIAEEDAAKAEAEQANLIAEQATTKKQREQTQADAIADLQLESAEDTFNNLSTSVSFNELPNNLKKQAREYKKQTALTQDTVDQIVNSYRNYKELEVSKRIKAADKDIKNINASESEAERKAKEARMNKEGAFESTALPTIKIGDTVVDNPEISLSKFQKQFEKDKTVGQALKRVLKTKGINIPQKALINVLLKIPGISEMNFGVFKHPDAKRGNKLQRFEEIRAKVGEKQVARTTEKKDSHGRTTGKTDTYYVTEDIYGGEYDEKTNIVKLYQSSTINTLLHEVVHAATVKVLKNNIINGVGVTVLGKKIMRMYEAANQAASKKNSIYGLENVFEFVAEAFTNPDFQNFLKNQESITKAKSKGRLASLFNDFIEAVKDMLGVPNVADTLLGDVLD